MTITQCFKSNINNTFTPTFHLFLSTPCHYRWLGSGFYYRFYHLISCCPLLFFPFLEISIVLFFSRFQVEHWPYVGLFFYISVLPRIDFILSDNKSQYWSVVTSHYSYWQSTDFCRFVLHHVYFEDETEHS